MVFQLKETKENTDQIALSILPKQVWEDLRHEKHQIFQGGIHRSLMYQHQDVSILFADIVGFTHFSSGVPAETLVWLLNSIFLDFDNLIENENLEKIKTIGDCYVLCAGVPKAISDHALKVVKVGLEMVKRTMSIEVEKVGHFSLPIRVGIHTGSVMAGLIGEDKLIYGLPFPLHFQGGLFANFFSFLFFFSLLLFLCRYLGTRRQHRLDDGKDEPANSCSYFGGHFYGPESSV